MSDQIARHCIAALIVLGFFASLSAMLFLPIPESVKGMLQPMVSILSALVVGVGHYYFGSSSGSKDKTAAMAKPQEGPKP